MLSEASPKTKSRSRSDESINTTIAGNDLIGNGFGVIDIDSTGTKILSNDITDTTLLGTVILDSTGTKILSNDISRSGDSGHPIFGPERANNDAKVVGNNISGGAWGIYVQTLTAAPSPETRSTTTALACSSKLTDLRNP